MQSEEQERRGLVSIGAFASLAEAPELLTRRALGTPVRTTRRASQCAVSFCSVQKAWTPLSWDPSECTCLPWQKGTLVVSFGDLYPSWVLIPQLIFQCFVAYRLILGVLRAGLDQLIFLHQQDNIEIIYTLLYQPFICYRYIARIFFNCIYLHIFIYLETLVLMYLNHFSFVCLFFLEA